MKVTYKKLLDTSKFQMIGEHLALKGGAIPYSISEKEFNFLYDFIIDHNLKCGYEVATGFGISALAAGLGFKETGGSLISLDSYVEGHTNTLYPDNTSLTYPEAKCFRIANYLMEKYNLDNVSLKLGWSPSIVPLILDPEKKLDYVFIDGKHTAEQVKSDIAILKGYVEKGFVFFHDISNSGFKNAIVEGMQETFGKSEIEEVLPNLGMFEI